MAKKTPKEIAVESFGGARQTNGFLKSLSNEAYIGYVTAMLLLQNPQSGLSAGEWFELVKENIGSL